MGADSNAILGMGGLRTWMMIPRGYVLTQYMIRVEADRHNEIMKTWDKAILWAGAWRHAWTGNSCKLVGWMMDTEA